MRQASPALQTFLENWSTSTQVAVVDLYIWTLATGEVFYYSGWQVPLLAALPDGTTLATSMATPSGSILFFSTVPSWVSVGLVVQDGTAPSVIPAGTTVTAVGPTTVQLSTNVTGVGVGFGDDINFFGEFVLGPRFGRTKTRVQIGPQVDELEVAVFVGPNDTLGTNSGGDLTWQEAIKTGLFDGAYCELLRAYVTPPNAVQGTITWFYGRVGDIQIGRTQCLFKVNSLLDLLTTQMPRRLFQSQCNHQFGGPMCGYDRVNGLNALGVSTGIGQVGITCQAGSDQNLIVTSFVPSPSNAYDNGTIVGTSGLNNGFKRTIGQLDSAGNIYFLQPWIFPVVAGTDTFNLLPGCNHTVAYCTSPLQNQGRYGGFPYIPPPETAI